MNFEKRIAGNHPTTGDYHIHFTTDDAEGFIDWLNEHCPKHTVILLYERSREIMYEEGGYAWRVNISLSDKDEKIIFKLTWG